MKNKWMILGLCIISSAVSYVQAEEEETQSTETVATSSEEAKQVDKADKTAAVDKAARADCGCKH